jgi:hypothetical protein
MKNFIQVLPITIIFTLVTISCGKTKKKAESEGSNSQTVAADSITKIDSMVSPSMETKLTRDPESRKDFANVYWNRKYTLYDLITDEPILPELIDDKIVYRIYYSSNEEPTPHKGSFSESQLENLKFYKFKNKENCEKFCKNAEKTNIELAKENKVKVKRDPDPRKDYANVFWKRQYTLFDLITDEPIFPIIKNGVKIYKIYYSSNEDRTLHEGEFTESQLEQHLFYKFKDKKSCLKFCNP